MGVRRIRSRLDEEVLHSLAAIRVYRIRDFPPQVSLRHPLSDEVRNLQEGFAKNGSRLPDEGELCLVLQLPEALQQRFPILEFRASVPHEVVEEQVWDPPLDPPASTQLNLPRKLLERLSWSLVVSPLVDSYLDGAVPVWPRLQDGRNHVRISVSWDKEEEWSLEQQRVYSGIVPKVGPRDHHHPVQSLLPNLPS